MLKIAYALSEVDEVAKRIVNDTRLKTFLFYGDMGVGKTTLIKSIVKALGSDDKVTSPSFAIVNEYHAKSDKIYHFDFYRINNIEEAYDFGLETYFNSSGFKLIEWPNKINIEEFLSDNYSSVILEKSLDDNKRMLDIKN